MQVRTGSKGWKKKFAYSVGNDCLFTTKSARPVSQAQNLRHMLMNIAKKTMRKSSILAVHRAVADEGKGGLVKLAQNLGVIVCYAGISLLCVYQFLVTLAEYGGR